MIYFITIAPHYKNSNPPKIVYRSDSKKDMLAKARQLVLAKDSDTGYMVNCWEGQEWNSVGAVIRVGERTAYRYRIKRDANGHYIGEEFTKVKSDGTLGTDVTADGIRRAEQIMDHWM